MMPAFHHRAFSHGENRLIYVEQPQWEENVPPQNPELTAENLPKATMDRAQQCLKEAGGWNQTARGNLERAVKGMQEIESKYPS